MSEFTERIEKWLEKEGYPLEMRVAAAFRSSGFGVIQSDYYSDPVSDAPREIDVTAFSDRVGGHFEHTVRVKLVVECKASREKPWLLFSSSRVGLAPPARIAQRCASKLGLLILERLAQEPAVQAMRLFQLQPAPAYGMIQALRTSNDDCAYRALASVSSAAVAAAIAIDQQKTLLRFACIVFPVIVVDAPLFTCVLDENSKMKLEEVDHGTVLWRNPVVGMPHTIVDVVTADAVSAFAADRHKDSSAFLATVTKELIDSLTTQNGLPERLRKLL